MEINQIDEHGKTVLYRAAQVGNAYFVMGIIGHKGIDVNKPAGDGKTALYISSEKGHAKVVD